MFFKILISEIGSYMLGEMRLLLVIEDFLMKGTIAI